MIDKKRMQKKGIKSKKVYNFYLNKREKIMKKTEFSNGIVSSDILGKEDISTEQKTIFWSFLTKLV